MSTIEFRQLVHFLAVADQASIGKAAARLNLTQPALSKSIKRLEQTLKVSLFERLPRGMMPTVYGKALLARTRHVVSETRHAVEEIDSLRGAHSGTVTVAAGPSVMSLLLPLAATRLAAERPNIRVVVVQSLIEQLEDGLLRGDIDLAIATLSESRGTKGLKAEFLLQDEVVVVARRGHPLAARRGISLKRLARYPWVLTHHEDPLRRHLGFRFREAGLEPPTPQMSGNSPDFMKAAIANSDHLTYLPRQMIRLEAASGVLIALDAPEAHWRRDVGIVQPEHRALSPAAKALVAQLHALASTQSLDRFAPRPAPPA